jgi:hypothetical protein
VNLGKLWKGIVLLSKASFAKEMVKRGYWTPNRAREFMGYDKR